MLLSYLFFSIILYFIILFTNMASSSKSFSIQVMEKKSLVSERYSNPFTLYYNFIVVSPSTNKLSIWEFLAFDILADHELCR